MLQKIKRKIDNIIVDFTASNIFTNYLGLARSILALSTLLTFCFNSPDTLFAPTGVRKPPMNISFLQEVNFFSILPYGNIEVLRWLVILTMIVVITGWLPKITSIIHFWIAGSFITSAIMVEGGDQIASILSLLLIPICWCDPRKNHWKKMASEEQANPSFPYRCLISNFFYFLIRIQVAVLYLHAAVGKVEVEDWKNGTAVYYWFNNPTFGMCDWLKPLINPLLTNQYLVVLITWGVIVFEFTLFLCLFINKRYYKYYLVAGVAFHFSIIVIHGLASFFISMTAALVFYLAPLNKSLNFSFRTRYYFNKKTQLNLN